MWRVIDCSFVIRCSKPSCHRGFFYILAKTCQHRFFQEKNEFAEHQQRAFEIPLDFILDAYEVPAHAGGVMLAP